MRVHQLLPRFEAGDAVSNMALDIRQTLVARGIESRIFAHSADEFGRREGEPESAYAALGGSSEDVLIYHYSLWCDNIKLFEESSNRKVVVYHNITPPQFFDAFEPAVAQQCRQGREALPRLAAADLGLGVSDYNRRELVAAGLPEQRSGILPIHPRVERLDAVAPDLELERGLSDGKANLLFVGRLVPNKRVEDLIRLFYYFHRCVNSASRLILAGGPMYSYILRLQRLVAELGMQGRVLFLGKVSEPELAALYRSARVYLSMSEHEGFCVPVLEAFHFGIPVMAYAAGAVPETMGRAGVLFDEKDIPLLAEMLQRLVSEKELRRETAAVQRERLARYSWERFEARLLAHLEPFTGHLDEVVIVTPAETPPEPEAADEAAGEPEPAEGEAPGQAAEGEGTVEEPEDEPEADAAPVEETAVAGEEPE
ncbi:MAG: glycosyltransferase [Candidatus Geothermincolia bacterium]